MNWLMQLDGIEREDIQRWQAGSRYSSQSQIGCEKRLIPSMWGMSIRAPRFAHQKTLTHSHTLRFVTHQQKTFAEPTVVGSTRNLSQCLPLSSLFHTPPSSSPMRVWRLPYVHIQIMRHFSNALAQPPPERKAPTNSSYPTGRQAPISHLRRQSS